ncbi:SH3 domain-containing protein [Amycolatopsis acidicola]|uniref:SH3 domain-containing protein n=1 Tax=Amycolatopsis acidicola TaxID=2596893 RepID=UPI00140A4B3D|nr:SH3 domain-containing protein [Amycolatopsis acidicola]
MTKPKKAALTTVVAASAILGAATPAFATTTSHTETEGTHTAACALRPGQAYVAGGNVRLRSGPGTNFSILGSYNYGQQVSLICWATPYEYPGWWKLRIIDGPTGYMRADYVGNATSPGVCR